MVGKRVTKSTAAKTPAKLRAVPPKTRKASIAARMRRSDPKTTAEGMARLAIKVYGKTIENLAK